MQDLTKSPNTEVPLTARPRLLAASMMGRPTPWEAKMGRYMRAPDHDEGGGGGGGDGGGEQNGGGDQGGDNGGGDNGGGGGEQKSWFETLPEDVRGHAVLQKYKGNPEGMVRGLIHLEQHMGVPPEQLLRLPRPDDAEGNQKLWNTLGRPETPDLYGVKLDEGAPLDQAGLDAFLATMHKAGPFTPDMAKAATDWYSGWAREQQEAADAAIADARKGWERDLRKEWGAAYDETLDAIAEITERHAPEGYVDYLKSSGLGSDKRHLLFMASMAKAFAEPGAPSPDGKRGQREGGALTPAEAEAELAKFNDPASVEYKALHDPAHPQHDFYNKRRVELFAMKRGKKAR